MQNRRPFHSTLLAGLGGAFALCLVAAEAAAPAREPGTADTSGEASAGGPLPHPDLSPGEVVSIQMRSLQTNDASDAGIRTTWHFASPDNKRATGPLQRFTRMIKSPPYRAMLNANAIEFGPVVVKERQAAQAVQVETDSGEQITYIFLLRRQSEEPYEDCWMTEGVFVQPDQGERDYESGPPGIV